MEKHDFDYDIFVIGGGSGGVRASRMSSIAGAKVGLVELPFNPISSDTQGGLGGTCVAPWVRSQKALRFRLWVQS